MDLSIVIPAFNEAYRIKRTLERVKLYIRDQGIDAEVLVIDDGSTDGTAGIVLSLRENFPGLELVRLPQNSGKGAAVRAGMLMASGSRVLMTDADLSTPIEELASFQKIMDQAADVVIGSRQGLGSRIIRHQGFARQHAGFLFGKLTRLLVPLGITDTQCGFKLFKLDAARAVFSRSSVNGFCFDLEVLAIAKGLGLKVVEQPVTWENDPDSKVSLLKHWPSVIREIVHIFYNRMRRKYR